MHTSDNRELIEGFVRSYLSAIEATVQEVDGGLEASFPPGRKRRFGRRRRIAFDADHQADHVELMEPGSPLLKMMIEDAQAFGGIGVAVDEGRPEGTVCYAFQATLHASLRKRVAFITAIWGPGYEEPFITEGLPPFVERATAPAASDGVGRQRIDDGLEIVLPKVQELALSFAQDGVDEARRSYREGAKRVSEYFTNLRDEAFRQEARVKKRLGEVQSKLYFTEDGLREIKLRKELEKLTGQLRKLRKDHIADEDKLQEDERVQLERQRRRYEPKLMVRLVAATVLTSAANGSPEPVESTAFMPS